MPSVSTAGTRKMRRCLPAPDLAAGAVVTREHALRGTEVVIVHRKRYDDWTLPKGKLDVGESLPACAVREVQEETGVKIRLSARWTRSATKPAALASRGSITGEASSWTRYAGPRTRRSMSSPGCRCGQPSAGSTYSHDHFLVQQYLGQPPTTPLIIVRHAKAMDRKDWSGKTRPPINSRGRRQAKMLIPMLEAYGVTKLVSSTRSAAWRLPLPYAHEHEMHVETYSPLSEEEGEHDPKGVGSLARQGSRRCSRMVSQPPRACTGQCCRTFLTHSDIAPTTW